MVLLSLSQENNKENSKCFSNLIYLFDKLSLHPLKKKRKIFASKELFSLGTIHGTENVTSDSPIKWSYLSSYYLTGDFKRCS